jgi:hypothetical protein
VVSKAGAMRKRPTVMRLGFFIRRFRELRQDEGFQRVVALARCVNAVMFLNVTLLSVKKRDASPAAQRQQFNSVLFTAAVLHEGLTLLRVLGKYYGRSQAYEARVRPLLERVGRSGLAVDLKVVRNEAVFHFGRTEYLKKWKGRLDVVNGPFVTFLSGDGRARGRNFYTLADLCAMQALVGNCSSLEEMVARARPRLGEIADVGGEFLDASEHLLLEVLGPDLRARKLPPLVTKRRRSTKPKKS